MDKSKEMVDAMYQKYLDYQSKSGSTPFWDFLEVIDYFEVRDEIWELTSDGALVVIATFTKLVAEGVEQ